MLLLTDQLSQRVRLGDLLIGRGKLKFEQLKEALAIQKSNRGRMRIGGVLVSQGFVTKQDVDDCLRYQLEEEICDLYAWNDATYEFEKDAEAETQENVGADSAKDSGAFLLQLSVDPQLIIREAQKRTEAIRQVAHRLSSPYMCFNVTDVAMNKFDDLAPQTQALIKLIRQGRTLETIVKCSYQGRLSVYKSVIRMLDDGWLLPFPGSELKFLASEHRAQGRYADALHIYRRLLESTKEQNEQVELQRLIEDVTRSILKARDAGERPEGLDAVRYKDAAEKYRRRRRFRAILFAGLFVVLISYGVSYYLSISPKQVPNSAYLAALADAEKAIAEDRFEDAVSVMETFHNSLSDRKSEFAKIVQRKLGRLNRAKENHVDTLYRQACMLEKKGKLEDADAEFAVLADKYPKTAHAEAIAKARKRIEKKRTQIALKTQIKSLSKETEVALALEKRKLFAKARAALEKVKLKIPPESDLLEKIDGALGRIEKIEAEVKDHYQKGMALLKAGDLERAAESFEETQKVWSTHEAAQLARKRLLELNMKQSRLREYRANASAAEARGAISEALQIYFLIDKEFKGGPMAAAAQEKIKALSKRLGDADDLVKKGEAAQKAGDYEKVDLYYSALLRQHYSYLVTRKISIPIRVASVPPGVEVKLDGKPAGHTPQTLRLVVGKSQKLEILRKGYSTATRVFQRIQPGDLELTFRLERAPVRVVKLPGPLTAPFYCRRGLVVMPIGVRLYAWDSGCAQKKWISPELVNRTATARPSSDGSGRLSFVRDKAWWNLNVPPQAFGKKHVIITTRDRKVLQIDLKDGKPQKIHSLPLETVGPMLIEQGAVLAGKALLAVMGADGRVRVFDPIKKAFLWDAKISSSEYPKCAPAAGALPGKLGSIVTVSQDGIIHSYAMAGGQKEWSVNLGLGVVGVSTLEERAGRIRSLPFAFVTERGVTVLMDLVSGEILWKLEPGSGADWAASALVGKDGVFVLTKTGKLQHLSTRKQAGAGLKPIWEMALDDEGPAPVVNGAYVFAATRTGSVRAMHVKTGKILWRFSCDGRPDYIGCDENYLYIATDDGKMTVLSVEKLGAE